MKRKKKLLPFFIFTFSFITFLISSKEITGSGTGLKGEYFQNNNLTNLKFVKNNESIDLTSFPAGLKDYNSFSVRWNGLVQAENSDLYSFYVNTNGGIKLWINDKLVINSLDDKSIIEEKKYTMTLSGGNFYSIKMEFYFNLISKTDLPSVKLFWSSSRSPKKVTIPSNCLYYSNPLNYETGKNKLYINFEENFLNFDFENNLSNWYDSYNDLEANARAIKSNGKCNLTRINTSKSGNKSWGKIYRKEEALIDLDLEKYPILRIKIDSINVSTKWSLTIYKTYPVWSPPIFIQTVTNKTGILDYNITEKTGWTGKQKLQIVIAVEGNENSFVQLDYLQIGSYGQEKKEEHKVINCFAKIQATETTTDTFTFSASGIKLWDDGRTEDYEWDSYTWNFENYGTAYGKIVKNKIFHGKGPLTVILTAKNADGIKQYATKEIKTKKMMFADYFVGYRSREYSGRSDLWWWYSEDESNAPWAQRPGDIYEEGSNVKKKTISYYTPVIGYYDQWDPATIEYSILLSKLIGIDGFAFEYQDNKCPSNSLMEKFVPYAQQYGFKLTLQWAPSTILTWRGKEEKALRRDMLNIGIDVMKKTYTQFINPTDATYKVGSFYRPVYFFFNWDPRNYADQNEVISINPEYGFGFTKNETDIFRNVLMNLGSNNPIFLACSWSFWPNKWNSDCKESFPRSDFNGLYGWLHSGNKENDVLFDPIPRDNQYYSTHENLTKNYGLNFGQGKTDVMRSIDYNLGYLDNDFAEQRSCHPNYYDVVAGTVFPGFDNPYNAAWGKNIRSYIPQKDSKGNYTIDLCFDKFINPENNPDIGLLASFGNWAEGMTIEPTQELGYKLAKKTAIKLAQWKGLSIPSEELLNQSLPVVVDIYNLRKKYTFLQNSGYSIKQLTNFKQAIDDLALLLIQTKTNNDNILNVKQKLKEAIKIGDGLETTLIKKDDLILQWVDENQGAIPDSNVVDLSMTGKPDDISQEFYFPDSIKRLINSGYYKDAKVTFEYKDEGHSWISAKVNNSNNFELNDNNTIDILKFRKSNTCVWKKAVADFTAASFSKEFLEKSDLDFELQSSMVMFNNYYHTDNALTVSFWAKNSQLSSGNQNYLVLKDTQKNNTIFKICSNGTALEVYINLDNKLISLKTNKNLLSINQWQHYAATWDGRDLAIYINGEEKAKQSFQGILYPSSDQLTIGSLKEGMDGWVDDLQIYNRGLLIDEIILIKSGKTVSDLKGHWSFNSNEGNENKIKDDSGNNNYGDLYNIVTLSDDISTELGTGNSVKLIGGSQGCNIRKVTIELKVYKKPEAITPDFIPTSLEEKFDNLNDWVITDMKSSVSGNICTLSTIDNMIYPKYDYGKIERKETAYINVDFSKENILRVKASTTKSAFWKIIIFDVKNWDKQIVIKKEGFESNILDFNLNQITNWNYSSSDPNKIKTLQIQIYVIGSSEDNISFKSRNLNLYYLAIGHYNKIPIPKYGFVEDFSSFSKWTPNNVSLNIENDSKTKMTLSNNNTFGYIERAVDINLETHPFLRTNISEVNCLWKIELIQGNNTYLIEKGKTIAGVFDYDIKDITSLRGENKFTIRYTIYGNTGSFITIDDLRFIYNQYNLNF